MREPGAVSFAGRRSKVSSFEFSAGMRRPFLASPLFYYLTRSDVPPISLQMSNMTMTNLSLTQLRQAVSIKERIDGLQQELNQILGRPAAAAPQAAPSAITPGVRRGRKRSTAVRARMAAAQRARWADKKPRTNSVVAVAVKTRKRKRHFSPEALERISAAAKARWAKAKASGKRQLG